MAYIDQNKKQEIAPLVKAICAKHGVKASLSIRNRMTLVLTITKGKIDFIQDHKGGSFWKDGRHQLDVNVYWFQDNFTGKALAFFQEVFPALNKGNHDNSDIQSDYYDVGWYVDIKVGTWDKPYQVEG